MRHTHLIVLFLLCWGSSMFTSQQACSPHSPTPQDASLPDTSPTQCFQSTPQTPIIREFTWLKVQQERVLTFKVRWSDEEGNVLGGQYQFSLNKEPLTRLYLSESSVAEHAKAGTFELGLTLPKQTYSPQQKLRVGLQIWDARGNGSNRPYIVLEVQP